MLRQWGRFGFLIVSILIVFSTVTQAAGAPVHNFHCSECHLAGLSVTELGNGNVCLKCHNPTASDVTLNAGAPPALDGHTEGRFISGDASNAFGHGTGQAGADQTSHTWAAPSDTLAAAGAQAPARSEHPEFYSRYGTSTGKLTCTRCHNPHEVVETNPKLLVMGDSSADAMCRTCHLPWVQTGNQGWLTHPLVADYNAAVIANPGKYRATLGNQGNANLQLVDGGVSCTSCHGVHFVDSDAGTTDGVANSAGLVQADGKLLRGNGPGHADKSSLCQSCHTYLEHGDDTGEKVGCMVCHSGHSYDPAAPNYYVLRKAATTATYNAVSGLDYSSPNVLDTGLKYTFWNDRTDGTADGYCEQCHGDAVTIGIGAGDYHVADAICTDCHSHNNQAEGSFSADCGTCHAFPPAWQSHGVHFDSGRIHKALKCDSCHKTAVHLNALSEISFDPDDNRVDVATYSGTEPSRYTVAGGYQTTPAYGQCDNLYCHSNVQGQADPTQPPDYQTPTWGGTVVSRCKACHNGGAHPGYTPGMQTGSHAKHLNYVFGNTNTIMSCQACHWLGESETCTPCHFAHVEQGDSTYTRRSKHVDGTINVDFNPSAAGTSAVYSGDSVPQTAYGSCSTTYCHSLGDLNVTPGQLPAVYSGELYRTPAWGDTPLGCNGCHGLSTTDGMPDYTSGAQASATANSHAAHVRDSQIGCQFCHHDTTEDGSTISPAGYDMTHANGINTEVVFESTLNQAATYNAAVNVKQCDNTYCHGGYAGSGKMVSPVWGGPAATACGSCHGGSNSEPPSSGSHAAHSATDKFNLSCGTCHNGIVSDHGDGTYSVTDHDKHINGLVDWIFDTTDTRLQAGTALYNVATGTAPPTDGVDPRGYGTCGNLYCHSSAQGTTNPTLAPTYVTPTWGEPTSGQCGTCHDLGSHADSTGAVVISTGSHQKHLLTEYSFSGAGSNCQVCHYDAGISTYGCEFCHQGSPNWPARGPRRTAKHVDGSVNVDFHTQTTGTSAAYSGDSIPGTAYGDCTNVYCHTDGTSVATYTLSTTALVSWGGGALDCDGCHDYPPAYLTASPKANSHLAHAAYSCGACHSTTTDDGIVIKDRQTHINREYNLYAAGGKYFRYAFSPFGSSCTSVACHGNTAATWGDAASYSCVDLDGDGICTDDNCPTMANPGQEDADGDGIGNVCDAWVAINAGGNTQRAIKSDGSWWAWGFNNAGQFGDGSYDSRDIPNQTVAGNDWTAFVGGDHHSTALKSNGTLWATGGNSYGQLGKGSPGMVNRPVQIGTATDWMFIDAGDYRTHAIKTDRSLWSWGRNNYGQLGDGTTTNQFAPVRIGTDNDWQTLAAGPQHTVAIKTGGSLWAWGDNTYSKLGDGTSTQRRAPTQIGTDSDWKVVSAGDNHSVAIKTNGTLWAWGYNGAGQLGNGTTTSKSVPTQIGTATDWKAVYAGGMHTIAIKTNGTLWAWGNNSYGQLGDGTATRRLSPVQIGTDSDWQAAAVNAYDSFVTKTGGSIWSLDTVPVKID